MAEFSTDPNGSPTVKLMEDKPEHGGDKVTVELPTGHDVEIFSNGTVKWWKGYTLVAEVNGLNKRASTLRHATVSDDLDTHVTIGRD